MRRAPWSYIALLKTPAGVLKKASICADSWVQAHHAIRELWPAYQLVRITRECDW